MQTLMQRERRYQCVTPDSDTVWPLADHHMLDVCPLTIRWIVKSSHSEEHRILVFPEMEVQELMYYLLWALNIHNRKSFSLKSHHNFLKREKLENFDHNQCFNH